jgi:hypothetical protein
MRTDDEVRKIMDWACSGGSSDHGAGHWFREFAEEVIAMRQRIAELEKTQHEGDKNE